jgi:hypothetical protein
MLKIFTFFCISLCCLSFCQIKTFEELPAAQGELIRIRGFLYRSPENMLILADQPNLKSCCVGKLKHQIIISGNIGTELPLGAVTIEGFFHHDVPLSFLKDSKIVGKEKKLNWHFLGGFFLIYYKLSSRSVTY